MPDDKDNMNLPKLNEGENTETHNEQEPKFFSNEETSPKKEIIEIPQEYYDQLEKEKAQKEQEEMQKIVNQQNKEELKTETSKIFTLIAFNAVVIFALLFLMVRNLEFLIFVIPAYIIMFAIINATKEGKESNYPLSVLIGGMSVSVITFLISTIKPENVDYWTYFALAAGIVAFLGMIIANIITKIITRRDEIKALETVGYILFFGILIGVPAFLYNKYPVEFHRIVFQNISEIKAETEDEFILKTLKSRYNIDFNCSDKVKSHIDFGNIKTKSRECTDPKNQKIEVSSVAYNEGNNQYIVFDNYTDVLFFDSLTAKMSSELIRTADATEVKVYFYPEKGCSFVGNCADSDEYRAAIADEENLENRYNISRSLDLSKYMINYDSVKFVNDGKFKIIVIVTGNYLNNYSSNQYKEIVDKIINYLNDSGLKNNYGFDILIQRSDSTQDLVYEELKVTGKETSDKTFKDYKVVKDANDNN